MSIEGPAGWIEVGEAADRIRLDPSAIRSLLRRGDLLGCRLGQQWLVDVASLERFAERQRSVGRPFAQRMAWSLLAELSGETPRWSLAREERGRLRRYASRPLEELAPRLRGRAKVHRMSAGPTVRQRLAEHPRWRLGGTPKGSGEFDAAPLVVYVGSTDLERLLEDAAAIADNDRPNLLVKEISDRYWPFGDSPRGAAAWPIVGRLDRYDLGLDVVLSPSDP